MILHSITLTNRKNIPDLIQENLCSLGIVGQNVALERKIAMDDSKEGCLFSFEEDLNFGQCRLAFAYPESSNYRSINELEGKTIATSYPNIVKQFLKERIFDPLGMHTTKIYLI